MTDTTAGPDAALSAPDDTHGHGSLRSYLIGFGLSAVLTAVPFWLVITGALASAGTTAFVIAVFALAQIVVQVRYFLHLDARSEGGWTLVSFIFTAIIVLITIGGSVWAMYQMHSNMMPMGTMGS